MSVATLQRRSVHIPLATGPFSVCILHNDRWHITSVDKPYEDVIDIAEDAFRRSGLPVQIRDLDETILFEANGDSPSECEAVETCKETRAW